MDFQEKSEINRETVDKLGSSVLQDQFGFAEKNPPQFWFD